jgi:two-component system sensor histidine kinase UhpB
VVNILFITVLAVGLLARNLKRSVFQSRDAERRIRALSRRLISTQEEERAHLARELHDDISQQIAALSIGMGNLKTQIPQQHVDAREHSDLIQQNLAHVAESIRRLSHDLHPANLHYAGLAAALRAFCSEIGLSTGVQVSLRVDGAFDGVPSSAALCVYRITQEALQNVSKHAKVGSAAVELSRSDGGLRLTVSDTGVGIEPGRVEATNGLGLVSMEERTQLVRGSLEITSKPNQGTTVVLRIPD